jgi:hypothetical protein
VNLGGNLQKGPITYFWNPSCQEGIKHACNTESHSTKSTIHLTALPSQEDAIIIAKSKNACPDDIILEDDIPDNILDTAENQEKDFFTGI